MSAVIHSLFCRVFRVARRGHTLIAGLLMALTERGLPVRTGARVSGLVTDGDEVHEEGVIRELFIIASGYTLTGHLHGRGEFAAVSGSMTRFGFLIKRYRSLLSGRRAGR